MIISVIIIKLIKYRVGQRDLIRIYSSTRFKPVAMLD